MKPRQIKGLFEKAKQNELNKKLHNALLKRRFKECEKLIGEGAEVNPSTPYLISGLTPLMAFARLGYADVVDFLIKKGAKLDARDHNGSTAMEHAAAKGQTGMVKFLYDSKASVDAQSNNHTTPLLTAVAANHPETVNFLISVGANVNAATKEGRTALMIAAGAGNFAIVTALVGAGANIEARDVLGFNPISYATGNEHNDIAEFLKAALRNRAAAAAGGDYEEMFAARASTARAEPVRTTEQKILDNELIEAIESGAPTTKIQGLIKAGAYVNTIIGDRKETPIMLAALNGRIDVARVLIAAGANVNARSLGQETAILHAVELGYVDMVRFLIAVGADVNVTNLLRTSPLLIAAGDGKEEIVNILIAAKANVHERSLDMSTPLILAAQQGSVGIANALMKVGAEINAKNNDGVSPLICAARHGHFNVVKALVMRGAGAYIKETDNFGKSAIDYATANNHPEISRYLTQYWDLRSKISKHFVEPTFDAQTATTKETVKSSAEDVAESRAAETADSTIASARAAGASQEEIEDIAKRLGSATNLENIPDSDSVIEESEVDPSSSVMPDARRVSTLGARKDVGSFFG